MKPVKKPDPFDYASYSLAELADARQHVNMELHADRAAELDAEWQRREQLSLEAAAQGIPPQAVPRTPLWPLAALAGFLLVIAVLITGLVLPKVLAEKRAIEAVRVSVTTAFSMESSVTVEMRPYRDGMPGSGPPSRSGSTDTVPVKKPQRPGLELIVSLKASPWFEKQRDDRQHHARQVALAARDGWAGERTIKQVTVQYQAASGNSRPADRFRFTAEVLDEESQV